MASRYVEAIRSRWLDRPYVLAGWSMGGVVAFEMARQLSQARQEAPLVILIDAPAPTQPRPASSIDEVESIMAFAADLARTVGQETWFSLEQMRSLDADSIRIGGFERAIEHSAIAREIGAGRLRRLYEVFRANRLALERYEPRSYAGRAVLVRAGSRTGVFQDQSICRWRTLAPGGISTHHLSGDHYTIMQEPAVGTLAAIIGDEIQRAEAALGKV
jgi:thioesterase domain-containing protein